MQTLSIGQAKEVVKLARIRVNETQEEFAKRMSSTQPLISRYESGSVAPSADLVMRCMHILGMPISPLISEADFIKLIKQRLSGDRMAAARQVLAQLICTLPMTSEAPMRNRKTTGSRSTTRAR